MADLDFDQMLAEVLRRFPADSIKIIRAKLAVAELEQDAESRD